MKRRNATRMGAALWVAATCSLVDPLEAAAAEPANLVFSCSAENDLYRALSDGGRSYRRHATAAEAVREADPGAGVAVLGDGYPASPTAIASTVFEEAARKRLRLFVEYPGALPGMEVAAPRRTEWERAVVASDAFEPALKKLRILAIHDCHFLPLHATAPHIVVARVAGLDSAVFGLPDAVWPLLFEHRQGDILVATTKLSQFVTARYAPAEAWTPIWRMIIAWLQPGTSLPELRWTPAVRPTYGPDEPLPAGVETQALRRGIEWYFRARMLVHPSWQKVYDEDACRWTDRTGPMPRQDWPAGDGSLGVLEGFSSRIDWQGNQPARWWRRHDCNGETAGAMALAGAALNDEKYTRVAGAIVDWLYGRSIVSQGERADPAHPAWGLIGWNDVPLYYGKLDGYGVYYGDDQARGVLGVLTAAAVLKTDRWDERALRCIVANARLAGRFGFQPDRIDEAWLERVGWEGFSRAETTSLDMNYQAMLWGAYLWAYRHCRSPALLERAKTGMGMTMAGYPNRWTWTNSMQLERARLLAPLAWLVRIEDTPEHCRWLFTIAKDVVEAQDSSGAIREALGPPGRGNGGPPQSNAAYGTAESTLIQADGDPIADLLYTVSFAFLGLHEAAEATKESFYREAEDKLARFLCRSQVRAAAHPELDGAWFRAFHFRRWEYWASNADVGWGAWCIETGWKQSWIVAVFALREMHASLWDLASQSTIGRHGEKVVRALLPSAR